MTTPIEFTESEIKEDLWAWNDFQDRLEQEAAKNGSSELDEE
jgi:hypothetical protein